MLRLATILLVLVLAAPTAAYAINLQVTAVSQRTFVVPASRSVPAQHMTVLANTVGRIMNVNTNGTVDICWDVAIVPASRTLTTTACEPHVSPAALRYDLCSADLSGGPCGIFMGTQ